jgi:hypothetical protein
MLSNFGRLQAALPFPSILVFILCPVGNSSETIIRKTKVGKGYIIENKKIKFCPY